jgi:hypothetical protein
MNIVKVVLENYKDKFYSRLRQKANTTAQLLVNVNQVDSKLMGIIGQTNRDLLFRESILVYDLCNERIYASNDSINLHIDVDLIKQVRQKQEITFQREDIEVLGMFLPHRSFSRLCGGSGSIAEK